jgi:membrane associated rhomboid family serine protease
MANFYSNYSRNFSNNYGNNYGRSSFFTPVIKALLIANVAVFVLQYLFLGLLRVEGASVQSYLMQYCALQPLESGYFYPWQLITYQFMHGGVLHLFWNMLALWMFGSELESVWGTRRFLTFYLLSGIGAGLTQLAVGSVMGAGAPTVGASGAIQGVMLAFGFMFPDRPILMFPIFFPIPAKIFVFIWIGIDLISGFMGADGVAHFAHLGGALTGFLLFKYGDAIGVFSLVDRVRDMFSGEGGGGRKAFGPKRKIYDIREADSYSETETVRPTSAVSSWFKAQPKDTGSNRTITQEDIDHLLDKIAKSGYNSLSEDEKKVLMEASKKL